MGKSDIGVASLVNDVSQEWGDPFGDGSFTDDISFCLLMCSWIVLQDEDSLAAVEIDGKVSVLSANDSLSVGWIWQSPEFGLKQNNVN